MQGSRNLPRVSAVLGLVVAALLLTFPTNAQQPTDHSSAPAPQPGKPLSKSGGGLWRDVNEASIAVQGARLIIPSKYRTLAVDEAALAVLLAGAPREGAITAPNSPAIIALPLPDGTFGRFSFVEAPIMEPALAARFPEIKTYLGQGIDDRAATVRFDRTPAGFHALILAPGGTVFIDPYRRGDTTHYLSYFRNDYSLPVGKLFQEAGVDLTGALPAPAQAPHTPSGTQLRTYRIAIAATGEYTAFHGGTVPGAMAAIATTLNRVNGVYEKEVAIRMVLIANNSLVVYTNPATDPYTNNNGSMMLGENQTNLDAVIGDANYDIGHVFSTGGGGVATLGVPCVTGSKARGVTGTSSPVGDPFDIDLVAHEVGHQFSGNHSFNGTTNNCVNRTAATAYEPASGSTIMGYAGICGAENLQSAADPYFHTISFDQIIAYSVSGMGNTCPAITATGNNPPVVNAGAASTIPNQTYFKLTGSASDPNGDALTYSWEQFNLGAAAPPNTDDGTRPIFRAFAPTGSPVRLFPRLSDILNNTTTLGEALPTTNRTLTFRLTARDNRAGGGGVDYASVNIAVTTSSGPFLVTAPNTAVSWPANSAQTVTWNVANTTAAPVSCPNVNILLSIDGGNSFPTLVANTPNDGTQGITVPNLSTTQARVQVECATNIFFDMSNVNFSITGGPTVTPTPFPCGGGVINSTDVPKVIPDNNPTGITSVLNVPAGVGTLSDLDLVGLNITHTYIGDLRVSLTSPGGTTVVLINQACNSAGFQNFANITLDDSAAMVIGTTCPPGNGASYRPNNPLTAFNGQNPVGTWTLTVADLANGDTGTLTAWGLRLTTSGCATATVTPTRTPTLTPTPFPCSGGVINSTDVPKVIPDGNPTGVTSVLNVPAGVGTLTDLDLVGLHISHTYIQDLRVSLTSPGGTTVVLINQVCTSENDFTNTTLDDSAATQIGTTCPPTAGASYRPSNPLTAFNGQNPVGAWTLTVADLVGDDTGTLTAWGLRLTASCATPTSTPAPASMLVGHVTWQGRPAQPNALNQLPITLTLRMGANPAINYPGLTTDAGGVFTVPVQTLPNGVYTWWAKGPRWLATSGTVSLTGAPLTQQELGQQRAGDVDNSNLVDIVDFTLLRATFGKACGDGGYDGRADWTGDCLVDIVDFTLQRANFGQAGPSPP